VKLALSSHVVGQYIGELNSCVCVALLLFSFVVVLLIVAFIMYKKTRASEVIGCCCIQVCIRLDKTLER
jgi:hypothetical protein